MVIGQLLLKSSWSNEAIFQLMMLAYNLLLLFKIDMVKKTQYWQEIKTFRSKYIFLAGKIVRTAIRVVMGSQKDIHVVRSMNIVCLDKVRLSMLQIALPFKLRRINYIAASDL